MYKLVWFVFTALFLVNCAPDTPTNVATDDKGPLKIGVGSGAGPDYSHHVNDYEYSGIITGTGSEAVMDYLVTSDGAVLLAGFNNSVYQIFRYSRMYPSEWNKSKLQVIKSDVYGNVCWNFSTSDEFSWANAVIETSAGEYLITGQQGEQLLILKLDAGGNLVWKKVYENYPLSYGSDLVEATEGEYLVLGYKATEPFKNEKNWILHINETGTVINDFLLSPYYHVNPKNIVKTSTGHYLILTQSDFVEGGGLFITEIDIDGNIINETNSIGGNAIDGKMALLPNDEILTLENNNVQMDFLNMTIRKSDFGLDNTWSFVDKDIFAKNLFVADDNTFIIIGTTRDPEVSAWYYSETFRPVVLQLSSGGEQISRTEIGDLAEVFFGIGIVEIENVYYLIGQFMQDGGDNSDLFFMPIDLEGISTGVED